MKTINFFFLFLVVTFNHLAQSPLQKLNGKQLFGSLKARHLGPAHVSGRLTDIELHPTNNKIVYVGTAGGGVWKSLNRGVNFEPIFDKHNSSIGSIAIDPNQPDEVIWVGTGETWTRNSVSVGDGLYKSTDGGNNWKKVGFNDSERISSIVIHPDNSDVVYVAVLGHLWNDDDKRGVYKTTDGGKTWTKILSGKKDTGVSDLVMDPKNPNILYAALWQFRRTPWSFNSGGYNSQLLKSEDGGKTWYKIHNGFPKGKLGRIAFAVAPTDSNRLYAVIESEDSAKKGLYVSDNGGKKWKLINQDFNIVVRPFYFARLVVSPYDKDIVVKAGFFAKISYDGGKTFRDFGNMHADIHDIAFDIDNPDLMYFATDGGFYISLDKGVSTIKNKDLNVGQFYHVSVDNETPYNVYGGMQDNGSWKAPHTASGGVSEKHWSSIGGGDGFRVFKHPTKNIIYSESQAGIWLGRYDMDKQTITDITPFSEKENEKLRFNWNTALSLSPNNTDRIYVGSQYLHKSDDTGKNWTIISPDLTTNDKSKQQQEKSGGLTIDNSGAENYNCIFTIAESPLDENIIWVGTDDGNVQLTIDGGKTWQNLTENIPELPPNSWVYHIEASVFDKGTAYAVFDRHTLGDFKPYVYKTTDFGKTWKSIATDSIKSFARNLQEDFVKKDLLYLGTEDGLYITLNGGKHWMKFESNMPTVPVHYITLQKNTNDLVLATHGRGIIIIDDISLLRQINDSILEKNVHFFDAKDYIMFERQNFGQGYGIDSYVAPEKEEGAAIAYYLKKRHTFGKMNLEILDEEGNVVVSLIPGKNKGINIVRWNFHTKPPKTAKGKTFSFSSFMSPRVPAGVYTVRMTKGKEVYETKIKTIYVTLPGIPLENRKKQEQIVRKLYNMIEDLAYLVYQVDESITYSKMIGQKQQKAKRYSDKILSKLTALKKTLVQTTGDNYTQTPEPELREKIDELYSKVVQNYDLPSNSQMKNLEILEKQLKEAQQSFEHIRQKHLLKLEKKARKPQIKPLEFLTFDEFKEK